MDSEIINLMVDVLEKRLNRDVLAYKPSEESHRFVVNIDQTLMLIDERQEIFVPLKRGDSFTYLRVKEILEEIELTYNTRTEYTY